MLSGSNCPFACGFRFSQGTTSYHHGSCKIDPIRRIENHLLGKRFLYSAKVIWQPRTIVSLVHYPVLHDFPIVLANVSRGCGDDRPLFVTAIAHFRGPPTDRTRAFEVIALKEELLTFVRNRRRLHNTLEIGDRDLFACGDGAQCSDFSRECSTIPSEHRDRKSTRLNSSHQIISYAVFCLNKKNKKSKHSNTNDSLVIDM